MTLTTVGYGDMMPYTKAERFLSLIYLFVGIAFVSYSIGSLTSVMQSSDTKTELLRVYRDNIYIYIYRKNYLSWMNWQFYWK